MRLGTKILILTLTITLALAGIIVWVVTRDLTKHETDRARADIRRAVDAYFDRINTRHDAYRKVVTQVLQEPQQSALAGRIQTGQRLIEDQRPR